MKIMKEGSLCLPKNILTVSSPYRDLRIKSQGIMKLNINVVDRPLRWKSKFVLSGKKLTMKQLSYITTLSQTYVSL